MKKFSDKLTEMALTTALAGHAKLVSQRRELHQERDTLTADLQKILTAMDALQDPNLPAGVDPTIAAVDKCSLSRLDEIAAHEKLRAETSAKIDTVNAVLLKLRNTEPVAESQVADARAAVAAAFERACLESNELRAGISILRQARACWAVSMGGINNFDAENWASELLGPPSDKDFNAACKLLCVGND